MTAFQGNLVGNNEVIGFLERHRTHHLYQSNHLRSWRSLLQSGLPSPNDTR